MSEKFKLRAFSFPDDIPALVDLKNTYFRAHKIDRTTDPEKQRQLLSYPGHQPNLDNHVAVLASQSDTLVGHVWVWQQTPARSYVDLHIHPQWERQGIGTTLFEWAVTRIREYRSAYIDLQVAVDCLPEIKFFRKRGCRPLGTYLHMELPAQSNLPPVVWADGFKIRPYTDVQDLNLYTQAMNRCYSDLWGHMADVSVKFMEQSFDYYPPDHVFMLFDAEDELAGVGRLMMDPDKNSYAVDAPGIVPMHRSPSLYRDLLLYCLHTIRQQTENPVTIQLDSWGDFDSTVAMFWELGFIDIQHQLGFRYYL